jgi:hypothetical protein
MNPRNEIPSKLDSLRIHLGNLEMANFQFINLGRALLIMAMFSFCITSRAENESKANKVLPLLERAVGDLDGDGRPDRASIIQKHDQGDEDVERTLVVELGQARGWKKILETRDLTPAYPAEYVSGEEIFPPGVTIEENRLWVHDGITKKLGYKLENNSFVLNNFLELNHSRTSDWIDVYELNLDVGQAIHEYEPPSEDADEETPPAWCPWAKKEAAKCRYPQIPVLLGSQDQDSKRLKLSPIKLDAKVESQIVTIWAMVEGSSIRVHLQAETNSTCRFEPVVKNLKGEVLTPVSSEQRRESSGTKAILEFSPSHFGLEEEWKEHMKPFREKSFAALELPCVVEVTVTPEQGSSWIVTSNPEKAKYAAPFVLVPAFVWGFLIKN